MPPRRRRSQETRRTRHRGSQRCSCGATFLAIEHVGSTAVPGMTAKPIIDIGVMVTLSGGRAGPRTAVKHGPSFPRSASETPPTQSQV
ncbi:MAG: hypothetical protein GTN78_12095 [Gemmatimonadales bacterium]|nr:hypothetical protein [Gemmatimonadales bacterium]